MKQIRANQNDGIEGNFGPEFDPHTCFSQFMEEARNHAAIHNSKGGSSCPAGESGGKQIGCDKQGRKWWKSSFFSWMIKNDKKAKTSEEASVGATADMKPKRGHVSGPIPGNAGARGAARWPRKPTSGPLASFFHGKRVKNEIPYTCLERAKDSQNAYGPVYLVS